jgi:undecaprenyl-diphosphatase
MWQRLTELDRRSSTRLRVAERPGALRMAAIVFAHSGDSPLWGVGLAWLWWRGPALWSHAARVAFIGVWVTAMVVQAIKLIVRRQRPAGEWGQGYRKLDPHSFPSGHAARAFMLASMALVFGPPAWAALMVAWAVLVSLARVAMGVHYLSDITAGAFCGVLCGAAVLLFH